MKFKRLTAVLCALAVVVSSAGGLPFGGLRLFDTAITASAEETETLLTTITATGTEQASYSTANVATVSFSNLPNYGSTYTAIWGWWGYGWTATVTSAEGYTITKCVFYDDKNRTATDSEAPFVVETEKEDKTPQVNGTPILAYQSKGITKIEVYGYVTPTATDISTATVNLTADNSVASIKVGDDTITDLSGFSITYGTDESHTATAVPTEAGTYYAYVTPKDTNTAYTGTAKSAAFTVAATNPTYTITIPESVNIDGGKAEFKAENVTLPDGAKINITVDGENTESGQTTFNAKNEAGNSTVSYTIKNGSADVADGGTALTFTEGGTQTLTFTKTSDPTYAGKHTETLTFGISVAEYVPSLADAFEDGALINVTLSVHGIQQTYSFKNENGTFTPPAGTANYYRPKVGLKKEDSGSLVVEASGYNDYSLQTARNSNCLCIYTFDTQSNKYSYVKQAKVIDEAEFVSISVNGTEIPVTQA